MDAEFVAEVRFRLRKWKMPGELRYEIGVAPDGERFSDLFLLARDALERAYRLQLTIEAEPDGDWVA
jgi:hypothetical protein